MDYAEGKGPPPQVLIEAFRAERWGLPEPGGRLDQPAGLVMQMTYAQNVYEQWAAYLRAEARGDAIKWKNADPERARFINRMLREKFVRDNAS